jgi:hypothetical protein
MTMRRAKVGDPNRFGSIALADGHEMRRSDAAPARSAIPLSSCPTEVRVFVEPRTVDRVRTTMICGPKTKFYGGRACASGYATLA